MSASFFTVTYRIFIYPGEEIDTKVEALCLEQSVELPRSVISDEIYASIVGKQVHRAQVVENLYEVVVRWPVENIGGEITQFLNVLFGNISLVAGIQVTDVEWNALPAGLFSGPTYGIDGIRKLLRIPDRALSCTALKPMGFSATQLAELASEFAFGGIDLIKDDHGLANQSYAPFEERLKRCTDAVREASAKTGRQCWYIPHISAPGDELFRRLEMAKTYGAGAVMVSPQLCAPEAMTQISRAESGLPIMAHPAFSGAFVQDRKHGFSTGFLFGSMWRAMGADFVIYPNNAGRFSFTLEECLDINDRVRAPQADFKTAFPTPGGGMQRETIPNWLDTYGKDTVFLIGGSLYKHPDGIRRAAAEIHSLLEGN